MNTLTHAELRRLKAGGLAALYLALAYLAAMPFFLLVVDYQSASTAVAKVALIMDNYASMYAMYLVTYVIFGVALGVLALALYDRLKAGAPFLARVTTGVGLLWSFALVISGMVFTYGMTSVVGLAETDSGQAATVWQAIEPVAQALGGAGGELLGGLWVLLVSTIALRGRALPRVLGWLGVAVGAIGLVSVVPPLHAAAYAFGLAQIVWFIGLGVALLRTTATAAGGAQPDSRPAAAPSGERLQATPAR